MHLMAVAGVYIGVLERTVFLCADPDLLFLLTLLVLWFMADFLCDVIYVRVP